MRLPANEPIPLWSGKVPYSLGDAPEDNPTITVYYPRDWRNTGKAVVILPGGGYCHHADHEGSMYAKWLAAHGYTAIVCYYRVSNDTRPYRHPAMISDAARAIRLVRANAADMGIQPDKIGLMGSSAGGHLAASTATFHELGYREEGECQEKDFGRPDFTILCYPVISMGPLGHLVEIHNTEPLRVGNMVTEDGSTAVFRMGCGSAQHLGESVAVENIVAQNHAGAIVADEFFTDEKCLCQTVGGGLDSIRQVNAKVAAVTQ